MTALPFAAADQGAWINPRGNRRYLLWRTVGPSDATTIAFVMLNPSTANPEKDDPTLRKCRAFAHGWSHGLLLVGNLFSIRGSDPKDIDFRAQPDLYGDAVNEAVLRDVLCSSERVIAAWGAQDHIGKVQEQFRAMCRDEHVELYHLGLNDGGSPKHPLFLPKETQPVKWT